MNYELNQKRKFLQITYVPILTSAAGGSVVTSPVNDVVRVLPNVMCSVDSNVDFAWKLLERG